MSIDLSAMQAFVQAARDRSFTIAAERLQMTQSAISKAISRLEADVGTQLLHRTTRQVSLTLDGAVFFERCCQILDDLDDARQDIGTGRTMRGPLRIATSSGIARFLIAPNLTRFLRDHPGLQVELVTFAGCAPDLYEGHIDLVLTNFGCDDDSLIYRPLAAMRVITCAAPVYLAEHGTPERPDDLAGHRHLVKSLIRGPQDWIFREGRANRSFRPTPFVIADSFDLLSEMAVSGLGIIQTRHHLVADHIADKRLWPILGDFEASGATISAVYTQNRRASPKVQAFIGFVDGLLRSDSFLPLK